MAEGQIWEAAEFAGHYKLENLTVIADVNALGQSEPTMYQHDMETYRKKFESEGFATEVIDGHDVSAVLAALDRAKATKGKPQAIVARTVKGHGVSFCAGNRKGVWFEGTAHLADALELRAGAGDQERAQSYLQDIAHAQAEGPHSDGLGVIAASRTLGNCEGERYYASLHTGATAWYALALQGADPFVIL